MCDGDGLYEEEGYDDGWCGDTVFREYQEYEYVAATAMIVTSCVGHLFLIFSVPLQRRNSQDP